MNPPIMAARPSSQAGRRASRTRSLASKPAVSLSLAPLRWTSRRRRACPWVLRPGPRSAGTPGSRREPGMRVCLVRLRLRLPRPGPHGLDERAGDGLVAAVFRDQQQPGRVEQDTRASDDGEDHEGEPDDHYVYTEVAGQARGDPGHYAVLDGPAKAGAPRLGAERQAGVEPG